MEFKINFGKGLKWLIYALSVFIMISAAESAEVSVFTKKFPNGLLWIHRPVKHNEIAAWHLFFPGGAGNEPADKAGLTRLMGTVMFKGTKSRAALQIAQETEFLGASLDAGSDEDYWEMSGQSTVDKFDESFALFMDVLLNPTFPSDETEKERAVLLNGIHAKEESIFSVAYDRLQKEVFGDHWYGRPAEGTEAAVSSLTAEDLRRWHKTVSNPRGAILVTVGNISKSHLDKIFSRAFKDWKGSEIQSSLMNPPVFPVESKIVEEKREFEQSYLMEAFPAPAVGDKNYAAVKVLNALLGAGMSSPLFEVIREQGSLAYEVSSFFPSKKWGSVWVIYAGMDPKNLDLARKKIKDLLADFPSKYLTSVALANAKKYIAGHFMMDHQTNGRMAWYLGWWELLGKGYAYDGVYPGDVDKVTLEDVRSAFDEFMKRPRVLLQIRSDKKTGKKK